MILRILFWACTAALIYVYFGYPWLARALAARFPCPVRRREYRPTITVVIAAFNEERGIRAKLDNVFSCTYPPELLDIIVTSDASTDRTDAIVREYGSARVRLLRIEGRRGKTACQNAAVGSASGEIVVFTDATTRLSADALVALAENFADESVGCAAGSLTYVGKGANLTALGGTAYWDYELRLRVAESALGSLIGVSGCLYAVRRAAYEPVPADLISDFVVALQMREKGLRTILETDATCFEETLDRASSELAMRIRVAVRSINALVRKRALLNPFKFRRFAWQLWSHKVLRYASPFLWFASIGLCASLGGEPLYAGLLAGHLLLLGLGAAGVAAHSRGAALGVLGKPYYLLLTNAASLLATIRYLRGERAVTWNTVR